MGLINACMDHRDLQHRTRFKINGPSINVHSFVSAEQILRYYLRFVYIRCCQRLRQSFSFRASMRIMQDLDDAIKAAMKAYAKRLE